MHVILDHLAATVVGAVVLLVLMSVVLRTGKAETDQQVYETSQRLAQSLAQQLEGDLMNVGYGIPASADAIEAWDDSTFIFHRRTGTAPTDPVARIEYRRRTEGATVIAGAPVPIYELERVQDGVRDGGTAATLSAFDLDLLDRAGAETADPALAVAVRVRFRTSFGTGDDHAANGSRYSRTFYPANLAD